MEFLGKRGDRVRLPRQLGLDPEVGRIVRDRAKRKGRSIEMQMVHFIEVGIEYDPEIHANGNSRLMQHATAQVGTLPFAEEHTATPQRIERHTTARKSEAV